MPDTVVADPGEGKRVTIPDGVDIEDGAAFVEAACQQLLDDRGALKLPNLKLQSTEEFTAFLAGLPQLSTDEKILIVDQALLMFQHLYPHLPFKQRMYNFAHPIETLEELRQSLGQGGISDLDFHSQMIVACSFVVDAHTLYAAPAPFNDSVAFLPFQIRDFTDANLLPHFVVTGMMKTDPPHPFFAPGAEIILWDGSSAQFYVENSRGRLPGNNYRARRSRGCAFATTEPLTWCQLPENASVVLHYTPPDSTEVRAIRFPWTFATGLAGRSSLPAGTFSVSHPTRVTDQVGRVMHQRDEMLEQHKVEAAIEGATFLIPPGSPAAAAAPAIDLDHFSNLPTVFDFQYTEGIVRPGVIAPGVLHDPAHPVARFGYIRIRNFGNEATGTNEMVNEFERILRLMNTRAPEGLAIDIRGNPGGDVQAAERMLQMLTPAHITPIRFHLANTPVVQSILAHFRESQDDTAVELNGRHELKPWIENAPGASPAPDPALTVGYPLTPEDAANDTGRVYQGRCALIVDALSYSAADIFAAGFQDHEIGLIYGQDPYTGAGGANVWHHEDLLSNLPPSPELPLTALPSDVTISLAIRRCSRVHRQAGRAIEDVGVVADVQLNAGSANDLKDGYTAIVRHVCRILGDSREFRIDLLGECVAQDSKITFKLQTQNVETVDFWLDAQRAGSITVQAGAVETVTIPWNSQPPATLTVEGFVPFPNDTGAPEPLLVFSSGPHAVRRT